jgi:Rrf2 family iron-sulfur cluster assembly transcriptional regulator
MSLLPRKGVLAIAAVVDIAVHAHSRPVAAKTLATRHQLPPRHLEPVLQALVRQGILKGVRGPRGGYELARDQRGISVDDIVRAAGTVESTDEIVDSNSELVNAVIAPALANAEEAFSAALSRVSVEELVTSAAGLKKDEA